MPVDRRGVSTEAGRVTLTSNADDRRALVVAGEILNSPESDATVASVDLVLRGDNEFDIFVRTGPPADKLSGA
jgi:hypothetical protein